MRRRVLWLVVALLLLSGRGRAQVTQIGPDDAIGFDYAIAEFDRAEVLRFEAQWDTAAWINLGLPETVAAGSPAGWSTYRVIPPFASGQHVVTFRACNAAGCGGGSVPFAFTFVVSISVAPTNVRRVPRF